MTQPPMTSTTSIISIVGSVLQGIKDAKAFIDKIPVSIFFPAARSNVESLKNKVTSLEQTVAIGFPKMAQLIRSYSFLISEVKVSKALADKMAELTLLAPRLTEVDVIVSGFINQLDNNHGRIGTGVSQLSSPDISEKGIVEAKLNNVRDNILRLKDLDKTDLKMMKYYFDGIATEYKDIEVSLSSLLEKILVSFEIH